MKFQTTIVVLASLLVKSNGGKNLRKAKFKKPQQQKRGEIETLDLTNLHTIEQKQDDGRDLQARIIGGDQSDIGEFPYYVYMGGCGGSLIAPGVVLSAAHCGSYKNSEVFVGAYEADSTTGGAQTSTVVDEAFHPEYNAFTFRNDFALFRLKEPINYISDVSFSINTLNGRPTAGQDLTVLGLGSSEQGEGLEQYLQDVIVQAIDTDTCNGSNGYNGDVEGDVMFCAGVNGGGKDSCQGDSGGPIVIRNGNQQIQVGVVSWGYGCARPNYPGVYAKVSSANEWIRSVVCEDWGVNAEFCDGGLQPTASPTAPPTMSPLSCNGDEIAFEFTIRTDEWAEETSWILTDSQGNQALNGGDYSNQQTYNTRGCIPNSCYALTILDSFGDGLNGDSSNPGYSLIVDNELKEEADGASFGYEKIITFGSCDASTPPPPTPASTPPPTVAPVVQPTPSPTAPPTTSAPLSCNNDEITFEFTIQTDEWPEETSWTLTDSQDNQVLNGGDYSNETAYLTRGCIPMGCYNLTILDSYGDGLSGGASIPGSPGYSLIIDNEVKEEEAGGVNFGYEKIITFGNCDASTQPPTPASTFPSIPSGTFTPSLPPPTSIPSGTFTPSLPPPTSIPSDPQRDCSTNELDFDWTVSTDEWGSETSWILRNKQSDVILVGENYENDQTYNSRQCIPKQCYTVTLFDSYGDGFSVGGTNPGYRLMVDGSVLADTGAVNFGYQKAIQFGDCSDADNECVPFKLTIRTDDWGIESSLTLTKNGEVALDESEFENNEVYEFLECLKPSQCNELNVRDSYGDGIINEGRIDVELDGDTKYSDGNFGYGIGFQYGNC